MCINLNDILWFLFATNVVLINDQPTFTLLLTERSLFQAMERGPGSTRRTSMQLTYMGNVYTRQSDVAQKPAVAFTYRRACYEARKAEVATPSALCTYRGVSYQR